MPATKVIVIKSDKISYMPTPPQIGFISLGCPKATVDSERILTQLRAEGYVITPSYAAANLVIVNTCGFIEDAVTESLAAIEEALAENGQVIVTGCLGVREQMIQATFPKVLAVTGPNALEAVMEVVHAQLPPPQHPHFDLIPPGGIKLTPRHYAYVKIAEGCNQQCSFCIIPQLRGKLVSRPLGEILTEAENLVKAGVKELVIVSQDTAAYGIDVKYRPGFWRGRPIKTRLTELARHLGSLGVWVRLHYVYPYPQVDQLVELMAEQLILPYLDVPLQHGSPHILKSMRRPADSENMLRRIARWREICPEITLRSTFMVGFPGESDQDFAKLLEFIKEAQLDRVGGFSYSPIEGAPANALPNAVPETVKKERLTHLLEMQTTLSALKLRKRVGQTTTVLIDEVRPDTIYARSAAEAPEVDGRVIIKPQRGRKPGDFLKVRITRTNEHDLYAQVQI